MPGSPEGLVAAAQKELLAVVGDFEPTKNVAYRSRKIIHDTIWGTCTYHPWEASLMDLKVFQRLRGLKQTGFAYFTYPTAEHSRFQHTLGVVEAASKVFDSVVENRQGMPRDFLDTDFRERQKCLLRIAALVHDLGHSVFSHTSERIYGMSGDFPALADALVSESGKRPGAAEVVVYLLVTSKEWKDTVADLWSRSTRATPPPDDQEWEKIGRWVMGQESNPDLKFLSDTISGPIDADKLDYVFRDGYTAGVPVGYDLQRLVSTVTVDRQEDGTGKGWYRLTIPVKGINALEQLVMGRLVLNSYLYHHQKCRAAETAFERALAREHLNEGTILGQRNVWKLFDLQDADVWHFGRSGKSEASLVIKDLLNRRLAVRVAEFRQRELEEQTERSSAAFTDLMALGQPQDWNGYARLIEMEDLLASKADLPVGSVFVDVPKAPHYADLENLLLPGRDPNSREYPVDVLNYRDWIAAYNQHRSWIRIYGPRGHEAEERVWAAALTVLEDRGLRLRPTARAYRSAGEGARQPA